ncbi:hypothetical protein NPIL_8401 [Nephila pilipes]|uniref:Uncharacterized protein n=1 Tax=Nephila pilipes TaxID=299642 RepID=A0A8X6Q6D8_NEPPI|nr:hypothetical protein NPIL_8401 [Nephila pilipes]
MEARQILIHYLDVSTRLIANKSSLQKVNSFPAINCVHFHSQSPTEPTTPFGGLNVHQLCHLSCREPSPTFSPNVKAILTTITFNWPTPRACLCSGIYSPWQLPLIAGGVKCRKNFNS